MVTILISVLKRIVIFPAMYFFCLKNFLVFLDFNRSFVSNELGYFGVVIWSERFFALVFFFVEAGVIDLNLFRQIWLLATSSNFCIRVVGAVI